MRFRFHRALAFFPLMLTPAGALAQAGLSASYDSSALRLESHFGDIRIVRGVSGPVLARIGTFRRVELAKLVGPSENAVREAREFERNQRPGAIATMIGGIVFGVSVAVSARNDASWGLIAAEAAGAGLAFYGGIRLNRAYNALSRSLWWYNRDLKR